MNRQQSPIGSCPSHWSVVPLESVADLKHGYQFRTHDFTNEGIKIFKITQIKSNGQIDISSCDYIEASRLVDFKKFVINKGDILMALSGATIGKISRYKDDEVILQNYRVGNFIPKPDSELSKDYFYYFLSSDITYQQIIANQTQSAQENVGKEDIHKMLLFLPPPEEQQEIADVLLSLDNKIDFLHRQNKTLEKIAATIFKQWFVMPIKKSIEQGVLVEGFENQKFEKWISETVGGEWGKDNIEEEFNKAVNCIRGTDIADLNTGIPLKTPTRFVKESKYNNIKPNEGDLIIEISGGTENQSTGRVCYLNKDVSQLFNLPLVFSNFCRMIRVKKPEYSYFLYCYIQYLYDQDEFFNLENGSSGIKNLDYKALLFELEYPMPSEGLVINFHKIIDPYFVKINRNKSQILNLLSLRDRYLPKLICGDFIIKE